MFTDDEFPPEASSIQRKGEIARCGVQDPTCVEWVRAPELCETLGMCDADEVQLFKGILPCDVMQGNTGDCWLLAAIAAYAEYPSAVRKLFSHEEKSEDGCYTVSLYDMEAGDWESLEIDDLIPTAGKRPAFAKPNGGELWVMLLEKAFAKFVGSYAAISGGNPAYAFIAFSGCTDGLSYWPPTEPRNTTGSWLRLHVDCQKAVDEGKAKDPMGLGFWYGPQYGDDAEVEDIFAVMFEAYSNNYVAACTWKNGNNGLVVKHVYSFIGIYDNGDGIRLLAFRNPYAWNSDEWLGDWSDKSSKWEEHPDLKEELLGDGDADGVFWMSLEDFEANVGAVILWPIEGLTRGESDSEVHQGCLTC
eukprot:TRINITY_DN113699_c0_g1_i1.p1 TRINITY_DN113699_c0_g1~~TRINITY_DN113699_c0_g1_i1.p1  ORF type:complete len:360 (+),score=49.61 TRINITY_DN113699_c0_g1_i1:39-1118(+)